MFTYWKFPEKQVPPVLIQILVAFSISSHSFVGTRHGHGNLSYPPQAQPPWTRGPGAASGLCDWASCPGCPVLWLFSLGDFFTDFMEKMHLFDVFRESHENVALFLCGFA